MAQAQENPVAQPEYLEFFGLSRPPFARLSVPSNIFDSEQYSLLMSHLAAATEDSDCLVVIRGADGSGKTTLLNRYLANLDEDIFFATIDDTCKTATEFYGAFLTQLGFKDITGSLKELRRITEQFLMHQASGSKTVLLIVDNAHHIKPTILEQLRRVSEISYNGQRVISVVIAGNATLSRIIDSPAMRGLQFRSHVDFHIRMFSEEETAEYINYRLDQAGNTNAIEFEDNSIPLIHRFTGGSPGPINKLCNAVLEEACGEDTSIVTVQMIRAIASNQELLPHVVPLYNKGRRKSDQAEEEIIQERQSTPKKKNKKKKQAQRNNAELAQLKESLTETRQALRASEKARKEAVAELKKEQRALKRASTNADKGKEKYEKLDRMRTELQSTVRELKADLKTADKLGSELESIEDQLREARDECKQLRNQVADIPELEQRIADKDARIAILTADMARLTESATATQAILPDQVDIPPPRKKKGGKSNSPIELLEISRNDEILQTLKLADAPSRLMIGRDEDSDLCLDSEFVSRHHALIFCSDKGLRIEDLNSFNGTLVNLKKVNRAELKADDLIIIGDFQIRARQSEG